MIRAEGSLVSLILALNLRKLLGTKLVEPILRGSIAQMLARVEEVANSGLSEGLAA